MSKVTESIRMTIPKSVGWMYLMEEYEANYGIFNHDATEDSLALLYIHDAEIPHRYSNLQRRMSEYVDNDVFKYFGVSFIDFLSVPRYVVEEMVRLSNKMQAKEYQRTQAITNSMENKK